MTEEEFRRQDKTGQALPHTPISEPREIAAHLSLLCLEIETLQKSEMSAQEKQIAAALNIGVRLLGGVLVNIAKIAENGGPKKWEGGPL